MPKNSLLLLFLFSIQSIAQVHYHRSEKDWEIRKVEEGNKLLYSFYVIGDAGGDTTYSMPVLKGLETRLKKEPKKQSGVIFLGDNIYPEGLHKKKSDLRSEDETRLKAQLDIVKDYKGKSIFIPGNHDWDRMGSKGMKRVKRQEDFVQEYLDKKKAFLPHNACPGPEVVKLSPGLVLIIIDTQWWLHKEEKPSGEKDGCDVRTTEELMVLFKDLLKKYRNQNVIVAGHHPLYSNGLHGGHFPAKAHLFPFTEKNKKAYVPLPVIGSIYPFYRKYLGHPQDLAHPVYQDMRNQLLLAMNEYDNVIYVAGHEHNLQYAHNDNVHHVVSGSGSKTTHLFKNNDLNFGAQQRGYSRFQYYENGEIWLEFLVNTGQRTDSIAFRKMLFRRNVVKNEQPEAIVPISYAGKTVNVIPDSNYAAGKFKRTFFGDLNRDIWTSELEIPYLDIHKEKGGLTPLKKGGGMQTISLRMEGGDGNQYTLRGIKKNAMFLTGRNLRGTITQDIIYDGMAGSHPYASVVIPSLSDVAEVYHANPTLVYVPKDSILGDYAEEFGGMFCLFEERPDGNMKHKDSFGNSKNVMNYSEAISKLQSNQDHIVDTKYVLNARLFDMLIGDWDRHDDQWRWASFKKGKKTIYRPIPRDRDQAFFEFDGLIMSIANRKWAVRKFQPFREDVRDIGGLNFNARYFDRSFLTGASKQQWIKQAADLQERMTDEVIENAIREFPNAAYDISGEHIIKTLKARRDKLPEFAARYYDILAQTVSITGTFDDDYFDIERKDDGSVEVKVYPRKKGDKRKKRRYYKRTFYPDETKEIIIYGLEGKDEYQISGKTKKSILVRIVAGDDKDHIEDKSEVRGLKKMTKVYEVDGFNELQLGKEAKLKVLPEKDAYDYDRKDFVYNSTMPLASTGYNVNDGFFFGPGFKYTAQGFKKSPYKYYHKVLTNWMFRAKGFNLYYTFDYIDVIGKADFAGQLTINSPLTYRYFGSGNAVQESDLYYDVRMEDLVFNPSLKFASKSNSQKLYFALNLRRVDFDDDLEADVRPEALDAQRFTGATVHYEFANQDDKLQPESGVKFMTSLAWNQSVDYSEVNYTNLKTELSIYRPINITQKQLVLGLRSGVSTNWGDYFFYQANFLSGVDNFRGIQRNRYSGNTSFYNNVDLRISLVKVKNYIVPFDFGILGHYDIARVWENGEHSKFWHQSFGGGVFVNILDFMLLVGTYSVSDKDDVITLGTGFLF